MKRMLFAAALAVVASEARAQGPGYAPPPQGAPAAEGGAGCYGTHPMLKKLLWWKKDCGGSCGHAGGGNGAAAAPGTLVFPQHPYARSPRDFFMYGQ